MNRLLIISACAVIAGCGLNPLKKIPTTVEVPVATKQTEIRYVGIDSALTDPLPVPADVVPGVTPWGVVLTALQTCSATVGTANDRGAAIRSVQGSPAKP